MDKELFHNQPNTQELSEEQLYEIYSELGGIIYKLSHHILNREGTMRPASAVVRGLARVGIATFTSIVEFDSTRSNKYDLFTRAHAKTPYPAGIRVRSYEGKHDMPMTDVDFYLKNPDRNNWYNILSLGYPHTPEPHTIKVIEHTSPLGSVVNYLDFIQLPQRSILVNLGLTAEAILEKLIIDDEIQKRINNVVQ